MPANVKHEKQKPPDVKEGMLDLIRTFYFVLTRLTDNMKFTYDASIGWTLKYSEHTFIHIVVPSSNSPDGTADCLIWGLKDKRLIPKYPSPIRKPPTQVYEIRNTADPKIGLGIFATRDIQVGDLIVCERPLLLIPRLLDSSVIIKPPTLKNTSHREAYESIFCPFFERASKDKQDEFLKLANAYPEDGIMGTFRTNNIEHDIRASENQAGNMYAAVYKIVCRVNHRCVSSF
jgi:hypothetical protein